MITIMDRGGTTGELSESVTESILRGFLVFCQIKDAINQKTNKHKQSNALTALSVTFSKDVRAWARELVTAVRNLLQSRLGFCHLNGAIKIERKKLMNECRSAIVTETMLITKIMFIVLESY